MELINHSTKTPPQSQSQISSHVRTLGPQDGLPSGEAYDPVSTLSKLDGETTDGKGNDDEDISYEELAQSYQLMYDTWLQTMHMNQELIKQNTQLSKEKNELLEKCVP